jgi:uncharacterized membrane protein
LLLGFVLAAVVGLSLRTHALWTASLASYDTFAFAILGLIWVTVTLTPQDEIRAVAQRQDVGRTVIFIFVIIVACAALFAVAFLIRSGKPEEQHLSIHLLLALATIVLSWLLMHAVFGLRYAHRFYDDSAIDAEKHAGGLKFPEEDLPDYRDFAYFSFVIGMTCQVSDVDVTSRKMRRLALLHGILSFGFNTVILALTINTVSSFL